jgi:hypothetical protein
VFLARAGQQEVKVADGLNPAIVSRASGPVIAWNATDGLLIAAPQQDTALLDAAGNSSRSRRPMRELLLHGSEASRR